MGESTLPAALPAVRTNGFLFVVVLVVLGVGATGALYRWRASGLADNVAAARGSLPRTPEGRLERWIDPYGKVYVHQRLEQLRFSSKQPWLVTHTVGAERNSPDQEIWGVDLSGLTPDITAREGLAAVVTLPATKLLGRGSIRGDNARHVPHYVPGDPIPDADARAREIAAWSIERLSAALSKDIPDARLVVRIGAGTGERDGE
jgi:hypothetical protein